MPGKTFYEYRYVPPSHCFVCGRAVPVGSVVVYRLMAADCCQARVYCGDCGYMVGRPVLRRCSRCGVVRDLDSQARCPCGYYGVALAALCVCPTADLMARGCTCGAMAAERKTITPVTLC